MGVYVAEIKGRGIAAVHADQISDAEEFVKNPAIEMELMVLENENDGAPLWDGEAPICIRAAFPEEQAAWRDFQDKAIRENKVDGDKPTLLAMNIGFTCVMLLAIALYLVAAASLRAPLARERP